MISHYEREERAKENHEALNDTKVLIDLPTAYIQIFIKKLTQAETAVLGITALNCLVFVGGRLQAIHRFMRSLGVLLPNLGLKFECSILNAYFNFCFNCNKDNAL